MRAIPTRRVLVLMVPAVLMAAVVTGARPRSLTDYSAERASAEVRRALEIATPAQVVTIYYEAIDRRDWK